MEFQQQLLYFLIAWVLLIGGYLTRNVKKPKPTEGIQKATIIDVGKGISFAFVSVIISAIIFIYLAYDAFTVVNFIGVFTAIFSLIFSFYTLYKIPAKIEEEK